MAGLTGWRSRRASTVIVVAAAAGPAATARIASAAASASWSELAPERLHGGLAGLPFDQLLADPAAVRLGGAVAAHVDPAADAAGPAQLEAAGDLADGVVIAAEDVA